MNDLIESIYKFILDLKIKQIVAYLIEKNKTYLFFSYPSNNLNLLSFDNFKFTKTYILDFEKDSKVKIVYSYDDNLINNDILKIINFFIITHFKNYSSLIDKLNYEISLFYKDFLIKKDFKIIIYDYLSYISKSFINIFNMDYISISVESENLNLNFSIDNKLNEISESKLNEIKSNSNILTYHIFTFNFNDIRIFIDVYLLSKDYFFEILFLEENLKNKLEDILKNHSAIILNYYLREKYIHELEKLLINTKKELEQKNIRILNEINKSLYIEKSRDFLFSNIYHELLTPLNSIIGFSSILKEIEKENEKENFIEIIFQNSLYLKYLILIIIDYSQFISNKFNFNQKNIDFNNIIENLNEIINYFNKNFQTNIKLLSNNISSNEEKNLIIDQNKVEELIFATLYFLIKKKQNYIEINFEKKDGFFIDIIIKNNKNINLIINQLMKILNNKKFIIEDQNDISEFLFIGILEIVNLNNIILFKVEINQNDVIIKYEINK
jgi:signal transduction histidine kinase